MHFNTRVTFRRFGALDSELDFAFGRGVLYGIAHKIDNQLFHLERIAENILRHIICNHLGECNISCTDLRHENVHDLINLSSQ